MSTRFTSVLTAVLCCLACTMTRAQTITTSALGVTAICPGGTLSVSYTATGNFDPKNAFTVQLSDASGSFSNFLNIGSVTKTTTSGTITATIPASIAAGAGYRLRVISSMPYTIGSDNGSDLGVGVVPSASFEYSTQYLLTGDAVEFTHTPVNGVMYSWNFGEGAIPPTANTPGPITVVYTTPGYKTVSLTATSASGCSKTMVKTPDTISSNHVDPRSAITVYSCNPRIPNNAEVDSVTKNYGTGSGHIWVQAGITFITNTGSFIVYAEAGSSVSLPSTGSITVYLKAGASYTGGATGSHKIIFEPGSSLNALRRELLFECGSLDFDYTDAPPNRFRDQQGVEDELATGVKVYPNPVASMLYVTAHEGLEKVTIFNELGQNAMEAQGALTAKLQIDVSSLANGTYYLKLEYGGREAEMRRIVVAH